MEKISGKQLLIVSLMKELGDIKLNQLQRQRGTGILCLIQLFWGAIKSFYVPGIILVIDTGGNIWMGFFFFLI